MAGVLYMVLATLENQEPGLWRGAVDRARVEEENGETRTRLAQGRAGCLNAETPRFPLAEHSAPACNVSSRE
ncbi:MAG TPA: hypothetical protein VFR38_12300 [Gaiellaceae bacterium]|nr:hypothetical protein [Gaiellaceae bacterium]